MEQQKLTAVDEVTPDNQKPGWLDKILPNFENLSLPTQTQIAKQLGKLGLLFANKPYIFDLSW